MFEEKSGMLMWREWRTSVSQRSPEIIVHRECAAEEGRRKDGRKWTNVRRKEWDAHVERMEDNRLAKIARNNRPQGVRSRGRPKKRWKESFNAAPSP